MKLYVDSNKEFEVQDKESIFDTLKRNEIYLVHHCGGKGTCSKCKVKISEGDCRCPTYGKLDKAEQQEGVVLACQAFPESDLVLETLRESRLVLGGKIAVSRFKYPLEYLKSYGVSVKPMIRKISLDLPEPSISDNISDLERLKRALEEQGAGNMVFPYGVVSSMSLLLREAGWNIDISYYEENGTQEVVSLSSKDSCVNRFGIAVDIGTTTVVVYLVNMLTGDIVDQGSTYNSQIRFGDDVITRIVSATEESKLTEIKDAVVSDINAIVESFCERRGIDVCEIDSAVISGNTTMAQLFWNLDPGSIREEPYIPTFNHFPLWKAETAGLSIHPFSPVYTVSCVGSYVGGDIVAGVLASKMHRNEEISLFMDIGTNGEIVVGNNEWLMTAACSAGPCFEGGGIKCGMRATEGAIESIRIDRETGEPIIGVIGEGSPIGICGSGMIDAISEMFLSGIIDQKANFVTESSERIRTGEDGPEYLFFSDEKLHRDIVLTKVDLENIVRAKAAIYAGVSLLLAEVGLTVDVIEKIYIAGGFGNYLNIERAKIVGMIPDIPDEKYVILGNTSIMGAYLSLLSEDLRKEMEEVGNMMTYMELSVAPRYMDEYMSAMFLPHTELSQFPNISKMLD